MSTLAAIIVRKVRHSRGVVEGETMNVSLGLLQTRVLAGLEIAQIRKHSFFPFLGGMYRAAKGFKTKGERADC